MRNVLTLALTAQSMLTALPETTVPFANAYQAMRVHPMIQFAPRVSLIFQFLCHINDCGQSKVTSQSCFFSFPLPLPVAVPVVTAECHIDKDCPSRQSCLREKCKDPCYEISPCAANAKCTVHNSLPLRTMSCTCLPGYTGKGDTFCDKIRKFSHDGHS